MTQTVSSNSIVLRSTHILLIEVTGLKAGPWAPSRPGIKSRGVDLTVRGLETLRGKINPVPAGPVSVSITQSDYAGMLRMQPLPGPWPPGDLQPGTKLVVFAQSNDPRMEIVLTTPACKMVVPAEPVLAGLRVAAQAEDGNLPLEKTLALAAPESARLDPIFAEFLWAKYGETAVASQPQFDLLAGFVEREGLNLRTRQVLLKSGYDLVTLYGDETPERAQRLALEMFRVLLMPDTADLHENLIETYLPNLLGITSDLPRQPASEVFKRHDAERNSVRAYLHRHETDADATPLLAWLDAK